MGLTFQATDVRKPLLAVRRLVEKGNEVVLGGGPREPNLVIDWRRHLLRTTLAEVRPGFRPAPAALRRSGTSNRNGAARARLWMMTSGMDSITRLSAASQAGTSTWMVSRWRPRRKLPQRGGLRLSTGSGPRGVPLADFDYVGVLSTAKAEQGVVEWDSPNLASGKIGVRICLS